MGNSNGTETQHRIVVFTPTMNSNLFLGSSFSVINDYSTLFHGSGSTKYTMTIDM